MQTMYIDNLVAIESQRIKDFYLSLHCLSNIITYKETSTKILSFL